MEDEIIRWITMHGRHVPIHKGESVKDAVHKYFKPKKKEETPKVKSTASDDKERQIESAKAEANKLNAESQYQDDLKAGNVAKIEGNNIATYNGKAVDPLDLKDAVTEPFQTKDGKIIEVNSLGANMKNGHLTPERLALHKQIMENTFDGIKPYAPGEEKVAMFTMGGGASGKGIFSKNIEEYYGVSNRTAVLDPDEIKKALAIADGYVTKNGKADLGEGRAGFYHEESSALAKQLYTTALKNNYPVMFDGTAANANSANLKIDQATSAGYITRANEIYSDKATVLQNALDRVSSQNRFVPPGEVVKAHSNMYDSTMAQHKNYNQITIYDNAGRKMEKVAEGTLGKDLKILNQESWNRFKDSRQQFALTEQEMENFVNEAKRRSEEYIAKANAKK